MKLNYKTCAYIQSITEHCEIFENRGKMISPVGKVANESSYSHHHSKVTKSLQASEWSSRSGPRVLQIDLTSKRKKTNEQKRKDVQKEKQTGRKLPRKITEDGTKEHHLLISVIILLSVISLHIQMHITRRKSKQKKHLIAFIPPKYLNHALHAPFKVFPRKSCFGLHPPNFRKRKFAVKVTISTG